MPSIVLDSIFIGGPTDDEDDPENEPGNELGKHTRFRQFLDVGVIDRFLQDILFDPL